MIINFNYNYGDGTILTYREPTGHSSGYGKMVLSPKNDVEIILQFNEILQPNIREFCSTEYANGYELQQEVKPTYSDEIEGQLTFNTMGLSTIPY